MLDTKDIYYVAAFLEAEGSFLKLPRIEVDSIDEDSIRHLNSLLKGHINGPYQDKRPNRKLIWRLRVYSTHAIEWAMTIYPLMHQRRKAQIAAMILDWRQKGCR